MTQDTLLGPPHTLGRSIVLNDSKIEKKKEEKEEEGGEEGESRVKEEESSQFIEVHKVDLGCEGVTSCSGTFDYCLHLFDFPFRHYSFSWPFQHLVFVARCLLF